MWYFVFLPITFKVFRVIYWVYRLLLLDSELYSKHSGKSSTFKNGMSELALLITRLRVLALRSSVGIPMHSHIAVAGLEGRCDSRSSPRCIIVVFHSHISALSPWWSNSEIVGSDIVNIEWRLSYFHLVAFHLAALCLVDLQADCFGSLNEKCSL